MAVEIILYSVEFDEIEKCQSSGEWDKSAEIGLLVKETDSVLPVFDTTLIHATKAAEYALEHA